MTSVFYALRSTLELRAANLELLSPTGAYALSSVVPPLPTNAKIGAQDGLNTRFVSPASGALSEPKNQSRTQALPSGLQHVTLIRQVR